MDSQPAGALLAWYGRHRRDLPWRRDRDPYRVWLSEVMLQQTRVETVLPYYRRFLQRFPTVAHLAGASQDEVLAQWSGLGYYRRARQLHRAAREIDRRGGRFPETVPGLLELPGIGPYTAAAVASIAFGVPAPALDGNVERVLSRRLAFAGDPRSRRGRQTLLEEGARLLDPGRPGDSNQALMELGATVCTPTRPHCHRCPLSGSCQAAARGEAEGYPRPRRRRPTQRVLRAVAVLSGGAGGERVLLLRRPDDSELLAGTWELPWAEVEPGPGGVPARLDTGRAERALAGRYGGRWSLGRRCGRVRHGITFRAIDMEVFEGRLTAGEVAEGPEAGWFDAEQRRRLPLSSWIDKALGLVSSPPASPPGRRSRRRG